MSIDRISSTIKQQRNDRTVFAYSAALGPGRVGFEWFGYSWINYRGIFYSLRRLVGRRTGNPPHTLLPEVRAG